MLEMSMRHPSTDAEQTVGYMGQKVRENNWMGEIYLETLIENGSWNLMEVNEIFQGQEDKLAICTLIFAFFQFSLKHKALLVFHFSIFYRNSGYQEILLYYKKINNWGKQ